MNILPNRSWRLVLLLIFGGVAPQLDASWNVASAGQPIVENFSTREIGGEEDTWITLQDRYGRLFVGGNQLDVFDGQSWKSFPIPNSHDLKGLAIGNDGRIWAGAYNEVGYFDEDSLGVFKYRSLVEHLPVDDRNIDLVWRCTVVGHDVYFFCQHKVLRWDGSRFQTWNFPGKTRVFPMSLNGEAWFCHPETGLYRVGESGPELKLPSTQLPESPIIALTEDNGGLVLLCAKGLFRPGNPARRISSDELSDFLTESRPAGLVRLPNGDLALCTAFGGIAIATPAGKLLRILNSDNGLPSRAVYSIALDATGNAWCTMPEGIFRFDASGNSTRYGPGNGLDGKALFDLKAADSKIFALTGEGAFVLESSPVSGGRFEKFAPTTALYQTFYPYRHGLLLSRHGGLDYLDMTGVRTVVNRPVKTVFFVRPVRATPDQFFMSEIGSLSRVIFQPDGSATSEEIVALPDSCNSLYEGADGLLWLGTESRGAFSYDPARRRLLAVDDPESGKPFRGRVSVTGDQRKILFFHDQHVLAAESNGGGLRLLDRLPPMDFIAAQPTPDGKDTLVAFKRAKAIENSAQGIGLLSLDSQGEAHWQEFDVRALDTIGIMRTLALSHEDGNVLWVGGSDGLLRLDYDSIRPLTNPEAPLIRLDDGYSTPRRGTGEPMFPFREHRLGFRVFTGDYVRGKNLFFQTRLGEGQGEWSPPTSRRSFEFSNLSEGAYRFEVRAINAAGMASEPVAFAFRILPPWYRSGWGYAGYVAGLGLLVFGLIRYRERTIRARNQELEVQVKVRTAELVKASAAKDEFLAGISHEIRNPMNGVIGIAETFKLETLDPDGRHKFGLLRQCATHLSSLLEDILDFSRVQAGMVELDIREFDLPELVESVVAMTAAESEKRGIPIEIAISPAVPARLSGDPRRIRQILLNFVGNALKFSGRGQISVTLWCKAASPRETEVIFAVSDEGPGISAEEQKKLFTRFERGAAAQSGRVPGTGLGLALCRGLAEKMGGRIWLESEPGEGSCFYFSAPFPIVEPAAEPPPVVKPAAPGESRVALVVDDEEYNRIVLTEHLETLGFVVRSAGDGDAALVQAAAVDVDVAFLDFDLPGKSGLDVARGIREMANKSAHALILATTAFTTPEKRALCQAAGMNAFLGKPVTMERLRKALAAAGPGPVPQPAGSPAPADGLGNLRLIANRKGVPLAEELALYLSEFEVELEQLHAALQSEEAANTGHYAHLLYGRCAFISERDLEQRLRKIESVAAADEWDDARTLGQEVQTRFDELRLRLASSGPAVPPG